MKYSNLAVFVSGSGSKLQAVIDGCATGEIPGRVSLVVSDRQDAYALERAKQHGIAGYYVRRDTPKTLELLREYQIDWIVLAGYLSIFPPEIIAQYEKRIINIHPSLIPKFCGKGFYGEHVHKAVLAAGERTSGATVHFVDHGIDTGPVILQREVPVYPDDTVETLQKRVLAVEHQILPEALQKLCMDYGEEQQE